MTANGEVLAKEEATVYVREMDLFVTVMHLENTPPVLSFDSAKNLGTVIIGREAEIRNIVRKTPQINVWVTRAQLNNKRQPQGVMRSTAMESLRREHTSDNGPSSVELLSQGCGHQTRRDLSVATRRARLAMPSVAQLSNPRQKGVHRAARSGTRSVPFPSATRHRHKSG